MTLKSYNQNCGLAVALDILGERWTLLLIRDLLAGPARFGELQSRLPGIGSNLLSERLKTLARRGVIEKQGQPHGAYVLSAKGEALRPIVQAMAAWGRDYLPVPGAVSQASWTMFNLEAAFRPERAEGLEAIVEFRLAGKVFHLVIRRQTCRAMVGAAVAPDVSIRTDGVQMVGERTRMQIHGDTEVFDRVRRCFEI